MTRTRWVTLIGILLIVLFAVVVGGFLWPRPQFQRGPWAGTADSARITDDSLPGSTTR